MASRDWEIQRIELGTRSNFQIEGANHCTTDPLYTTFVWSVDSVADPRYFAASGLVISEAVQRRLNLTGQIGSGIAEPEEDDRSDEYTAPPTRARNEPAGDC